jgi:8-oxo-dGTP pyrophosphatase MutT (NUDIX family)
MSEQRFAMPDWLADDARRFVETGAQPVPPRLAATVLFLRPAAAGPTAGELPGGTAGGLDGFEVYTIRRAATMAFAASMYAFPGGRVDPRDATEHLRWAGPDLSWWGERLGQDEATARAVVCAAAREVFEETGVLLADAGPDAQAGPAAELPPDSRRACEAREVGFADLLAEHGLTLRSDLLAPWARWITPEFEPRRYDTYFFLARLPDGQRARRLGTEADHSTWVRPDAAVAGWDAGELAMLPPTYLTLRQLTGYADVAAAMEAADARDVATPVCPQARFGPQGPYLVL